MARTTKPAAPLPAFRIIRGTPGATHGFGATYRGKTARDAVKAENKAHRQHMTETYGGLLRARDPSATVVISVFALVKVDEKDWK